jgi:hypothetical protein
VGELDASLGAKGVNLARHSAQSCDLFVSPDAQVTMRNPTSLRYCHCFREHKPEAAHGELRDVSEMKVIGHPVMSRIGAHRRKYETVFQLDSGKPEGTE